MGTKSRRAARELALNILYQIDVAKLPSEEAIHVAIESTGLESNATEFAAELVRGTLEKQEAIDKRLKDLSIGWDPGRQPSVDRNILRMAIFEILYLDQVPSNVSINEAVELAKKFSTDESGKFINGVLGTLVREEGEEEDAYACTDS